MSDPELIDRILQTCSYRFRNVMCPNKDKTAKIAAGKLQTDDAEWTVIECSLMPDGEIDCAMTCSLKRDRSFQVIPPNKCLEPWTTRCHPEARGVCARRISTATPAAPSHSTRDDDAPLRSGNAGQRQFA